MNAKILSLNVGHPQPIEWNGKSLVSSMLKTPQEGPLVVSERTIVGDSFANSNSHGMIDSVIYAFGMKSLLLYTSMLGRNDYAPGALGENVTLDDLDEYEVSVGDVFQFGEVRAQATFPRIPCAKVDLRMQHKDGRQLLVDCGRSGIYFRVLKPGKIHHHDNVERVEQSKVKFLISEIYLKATKNIPLTGEEVERAIANGAFPVKMIERWRAQLI
jgi:MOSC domain-containing protein YiiM